MDNLSKMALYEEIHGPSIVPFTQIDSKLISEMMKELFDKAGEPMDMTPEDMLKSEILLMIEEAKEKDDDRDRKR